MSDWLSEIEKGLDGEEMYPPEGYINIYRARRMPPVLRELANALSSVSWHPKTPRRDCVCTYCKTLSSLHDDAKELLE